VEIDMSKIKCITTPLPIMVGKRRYSFIVFEDLYEMCLRDISLFDDMAENVQDIGSILEKRELVLAAKCLESLIWLMSNQSMKAIARELLTSHTPWPVRPIAFTMNKKLRGYNGPCTWPDCPSD
jgi:hypothetical protein